MSGTNETIDIREFSIFHYLVKIQQFFIENADFIKTYPEQPYLELFNFRHEMLSTSIQALNDVALYRMYEKFHNIMRNIAEC